MELTIGRIKQDYPDYNDYRIIDNDDFEKELEFANYSEDQGDYSVIITSDNVILACEL